MNQKHFDEFCELMDSIAEQYSKTMTMNTKAIYWQALFDVDFEAVREALFRHIRNTDTDGDFMPKVSNIRKMIEGSTEDSALVAWTKVDREVRVTGPYQSVVFDDPIIHRVIQDMGGWIQFGTKTDDDWPFVAKEFQTRYRGFKSRGLIPDYQPYLVGLTEANNAKEGFKADPPELLGDVEKSRLVLEKGIDGVGVKQIVGFVKQIKNKEK